MTNTFLDRAREAAQHAVAGAQDALAAAQHKLDDLSRASQLDDKLADLGAAFYTEQRSGGTRADVDVALQAVDAHVQEHGWSRGSAAPPPPSTATDGADAGDVVETVDPGEVSDET